MSTQTRFARALDTIAAATSRHRVIGADQVREARNGIDPSRLVLKVNNLERQVAAIEKRIAA